MVIINTSEALIKDLSDTGKKPQHELPLSPQEEGSFHDQL